MHKILVEVKNNTLSFSLYGTRGRVENLNNTNIVNTEKMVFSDKYINENLDLIQAYYDALNEGYKINLKKVNPEFSQKFEDMKNM